MSDSTGRYMFAGHAIGAQARFHRLDDLAVNEVVPAIGATVLSGTGGRSEFPSAGPFRYWAEKPRRRCLLAVDQVNTWVEGRDPEGRFETEFAVEVDGFEVLEKLRIDSIRLHLLATRSGMESDAVVTTRGNRVEGLRMGNVVARIEFDDEPLTRTGSQQQLAEFYRGRNGDYRQRNRWRFHTTPDGGALADDHGHHRFSLVRAIELSGPESEKQAISVDGYTIYWRGFGRIILGEVHVKGQDRRISLVRLAMGSNGGGSGTGGGGGSNGQPTG